MLLVGVEDADSNFDLDYAVRKIAQMRIFSDEADKMNLSVQDIQGEILSISQFTLYAETKKVIVRAFLRQENLILLKQCMKNSMTV